MPQPEISDALWKSVPEKLYELVKEGATAYSVISEALPSLPLPLKVYYSPNRKEIFFNYPPQADSEKVAEAYLMLRQLPNIESIEQGDNTWCYPPDDVPYIRVKQAIENSSIFGPISSAMQLQPNFLNKMVGGPNPLLATLAGGALGAGAGYGLGWLGEKVLPKDYFDKGKLRRTLAILGGIGGAAPGLHWAFDNLRADPQHSGSWRALISPYPWTQEAQNRFAQPSSEITSHMPMEVRALDEAFIKAADIAGGEFENSIPVDQFNRVVWNDLRSMGGSTPSPIAAAATGLTTAASLSQGGANLISPMDIARIGMGAGSGYISSLLVGKTLGALAGLNPATQQKLQQVGIWGGVLSNIIPLAFH